MGLLKGKLLAIGVIASLLGATAHAQEVTASETDPMVLFEKSLAVTQNKIKEARGLDPVQRQKVAQELIDQSEAWRKQVADLERITKILGENVMVAGLIISYQGEYNFTTPWQVAQVTPGGEYGVAVVFKKNEQYVSDSIRGAFVAIAGVGGELQAKTAIQRRNGVDRGWRLKVLFTNNGNGGEVRGVNLTDFEGAYTGIGGEVHLFGRDIGAQIYTKPETCTNIVNPASCSVYILNFAGTKGEKQGAAVVAKEIMIDFQFDNNGEGFGF
jgi:hypothetical protein